MIGLSAMSFQVRNANSSAMTIRIFVRSHIAIFLRVRFTSASGTGTCTGGGGGGGAGDGSGQAMLMSALLPDLPRVDDSVDLTPMLQVALR